MTRGIVIGKFYPPHKGHSRLIEFGLSQCDSLTVLVCDNPGLSIDVSLRARWLVETFPKANVRIIPDILDDDNSEAWAAHTKAFLGFAPDYVFTGSEPYGDPYAKFLGAKHLFISRNSSATKIRTNPLKYLDELEPLVRAYFVRRVCILGSESTGTTTLAKALAKHYQTAWVPEYGRVYSEAKQSLEGNWSSDEFIHIARLQAQMEDKLAQSANKVLICDTDSFATSVWHERYMGTLSLEVEEFARSRKYDLYLVTDLANVAFEDDGTRDGEHLREWMQNRFIEKLTEWRLPFVVVSGSPQVRLEKAISLIDPLVGSYSIDS